MPQMNAPFLVEKIPTQALNLFFLSFFFLMALSSPACSRSLLVVFKSLSSSGRKEVWKEKALDDLPSNRAIVNQTNVGTISKAAL